MENQDVIDRNSDDLVSEEMNTDESGKNVFYKYRGVGKCISDGVSFITDHFFRFMKITLPVSILLAIFCAAFIYIACDISLMLSEGVMYIIASLGIAVFLVYSVFQSLIFQLLKLHTKNVEMKNLALRNLYKSIWGICIKIVGYNALLVVIGSIIALVSGFILSIPLDGLGMDIVKYCIVGLWVLVAVVVCLPYGISLPALVFGEHNFFRALWHGYVLGLKKIGKVTALFIIVFFIVELISLLLLSPAIIISMVQHSASFSLVAGDSVHLPDNFAIYSILILFLASFLSLLLTWMYYVPMSYLYASFIHDVEEQKKSKLPIV